MTKILWFSRHTMSEEQLAALANKFGEIELKQIDRTIASAYELQEEIEWADCVAIVAPINLQQQFVKLAGERPVITAINARELIKSEDGTETKTVFKFVEWQRIVKVEVVTEHFC